MGDNLGRAGEKGRGFNQNILCAYVKFSKDKYF